MTMCPVQVDDHDFAGVWRKSPNGKTLSTDFPQGDVWEDARLFDTLPDYITHNGDVFFKSSFFTFDQRVDEPFHRAFYNRYE